MANDDDKITGLEDENLFPEEDDFNLDDDIELDLDDEEGIPGMEVGDAAAATTTQIPGQSQSKLKSMMVPLVIGGVLFGFVGYKLLGLLSGGAEEEDVTISAAPTAPTQTPGGLSPDQVAALTGQPAAPTAPASDFTFPEPEAPTPAVDDLKDTVGELAQQLPDQVPQNISPEAEQETFSVLQRDLFQDQASQEITNFEQEITKSLQNFDKLLKQRGEELKSVNANIGKVAEKLDILGKGMGKLNREIDQLQLATKQIDQDMEYLKSQELVREEERKAVEAKKQPKSKISHDYKIEATIPGRAWLKNKDGKTITVSEGDTLEGLGRILIIDAFKSAVVTSSGVVVR